MSPLKPLITPWGSIIRYQGNPLEKGLEPAVIFFALSAKQSLFSDPINQPVVELNKKGIRVFSWDLPFHGLDEFGVEQDPHKAMQRWALEFAKNSKFISDFIDICQENILFLEDKGMIDLERTAVAGLSRGGFIASHLAAKFPKIKIVLGYAPLTCPRPLEEFNEKQIAHFNEASLHSIIEELMGKDLRFYIGNHDLRVGTETCFQFIHRLTEISFEKGIRSPPVELIIYPSIGHKGHGTPPEIFNSGAEWLASRLLKGGLN